MDDLDNYNLLIDDLDNYNLLIDDLDNYNLFIDYLTYLMPGDKYKQRTRTI